MGTNNKTAKLAGSLWLLMFIFGPIAQIVRSRLIVDGDAAATAQNIMAEEFLFRLGFASDLIMMTLFLLLPLVLYKLLHRVDRNLAALMVAFVVVSVPINMLNLLNEYTALQILSGADYLSIFGADQLAAQAMLAYRSYLNGYEIANIFFALWLIPLGMLVYRSGFLPRVLGVLLVVGGCGLFIGVFVYFLIPGQTVLNAILLLPQTAAEFAFILWVLIKGINGSKVNEPQFS